MDISEVRFFLFQYSNRLLLIVLVVGGVFAADAPAQSVSWSSHTSMRRVNDIDVSATHVWSATRGGVFSYELETGEISTFSVVDGLHNVDVRTVAIDSERAFVWLGYGDGVLDRIDQASGEIVSFRDIERATQFASRGINRILVRGDSVLVATQFGVVVFDPVKSEVRDAYTRLGDNPAATEIYDVLVASDESGILNFWAATVDGVARAPLTTSNLQDPTSWTVERDGFSLESGLVRSLAFFDGAIYAGTEVDAYRRDATSNYSRLSVSSRAVTDLHVTDDQMMGVERFSLLVFEAGGVKRSVGVAGYQDPVAIAGDGSSGYWFGDGTLGLTSIPQLSTTVGTVEANYSVIPAGPYDGLFSELVVETNGNLWAGGVGGSATGVYNLTADGEWTTYSSVFYPELEGKNTFSRVHVDASGIVWAGSAGGGVARIEPDGQVTTFDQTNSSLVPASGLGAFLPIGGVATDEDGTLWVSTRASSFPFHVRSPDGNWSAFGPFVGNGLTARSTAYDRIFVDSFGQKWIVVLDENNFQVSRGLLVLDTGAPEVAEDDVFHFFGENGSSGQGLPSRAVRYVTEDRDGLVWLGTESGPAYFVNSGIVAVDASARAIWPQWADRSQGTFMLFGLAINGIAVDPANQLWFATNDGAYLVKSVEGGYETVQHFTSENSPIFSDEVLSVAVNGLTGEVYFSTSLGLVSYQGDAVTPSRSAKNLFIYPNPVHMSNGSSPEIFIDGLVEETDIRILTATGSLVRSLTARGGRTRWDGRDETGALVSSGVYLVVAVGAEGGSAAHGKVAVIR